MCGIVGYVGEREALPIILKALKRIEYRGYDSCGVFVQNQGELMGHKEVGAIDCLISSLSKSGYEGKIAIGHSRWATHGAPTVTNAHPHLDCNGEIAVVHNGIIEN